jgi:hypothetical protein
MIADALVYLGYFLFVPETAIQLMPALTAWCPTGIVAVAGLTATRFPMHA